MSVASIPRLHMSSGLAVSDPKALSYSWNNNLPFSEGYEECLAETLYMWIQSWSSGTHETVSGIRRGWLGPGQIRIRVED